MLNIVLLLILAIIFARGYFKLRSPFNLGLLFFALILFIQALLICPFSQPFTEAYCTYLPHHAYAAIFESIALIVLLYLVTR